MADTQPDKPPALLRPPESVFRPGQVLYELRRLNQNLGVVTICAAGGVGFAMMVERE